VPLVLAILVVAVAAGVLSRIVSVARGRSPGGASARWFFVLPPLGFAVQGAIEPILHVEAFPRRGLHEPAFPAALLLQIPFGLMSHSSPIVHEFGLARDVFGLSDEQLASIAFGPDQRDRRVGKDV
jgi:hypothetical protein